MSRILMAAGEAAPFAKSGGLADVVGALPYYLEKLGHDVCVVLPRYRSISLDGAERLWQDLKVQSGPHLFSCDLWGKRLGNVRFLFVDCPPLFDRGGALYGHGDDHLRFAVYCQAVLGAARFLFRPDVLHLHDWQAALCAAYQRTTLALDPILRDVRLVFTIHNLEYNGRFGFDRWGDLGLDRALLRPDLMEFHGTFAILKAGIVFADALTTVSPRYAQEIQTPEFGFGLDGLLRTHSGKLTGILNGVDYLVWSPENDSKIIARYSADDLSGKQACKSDLLRHFNLPPENMARPLLGIVSRFASQKGFDIIESVIWDLMREDDVALAVLGNAAPGSPEVRYEGLFRHVRSAFPDRVGIYLGFDDQLAHKIEAGADIFLMPSRFEPCGLNQMYSLKYGTVPVVRSTGGLENTVDAETGFKFWGYWPPDFRTAVRLALHEFRTDPLAWQNRMRTGMRRDYSWNASARQYSDLYAGLLGQAQGQVATAGY